MDSSKKYENPSPEASANIFSKLFYCWTLPFFRFGYKNGLQVKDIYNATEQDLSAPLGDELQKNWEKEIQRANKKKETPSLRRAIFNTFYKTYSMYGLLIFSQCIILKMLQPIVLAEYIRYYDLSTKEANPETGWLLGIAVVLMAFANIVVMHFASIGCQRIGMRIRVACCSLVYRKLLKLSQASLGQTAAGQLVNLLSNDVQRFDMASNFLHYVWIMPIQAVIAFYVMYRSVGIAAVAGMLAISLEAIPLQGYMSSLQGKWRGQIALRTDHRVKLMSEITSGIQVIKMYAWEKPFEKVIEIARRLEIDVVRKTSYIKGISMAIMVFTERVTLYLTIITYVLLGNRLTGDVVFSMAQLFNTVQLYMSILYPMATSSYAEAMVSIKRLEKFLLLEENTELSLANRGQIIDTEKKGTVRIVKANASWLPNPIVYTLMDVNLDIPPGTLCCIVGNVGSGKSSLLQLLLRELPLSSGRVDVSGSISYASQEPWLFVSSVRNNVLFGKPFLKSRYREVVKACALETDFQQFPYGDKTMVGERGVSLSGGQRARINLARAVYFDADIYLLDDPLSAVDTHVGKHLFQECFKKYLRTKTRILVTHQLQFIKEADLIVIVNNGRIDKVCKYNELTEGELSSLNQEQVKEEKKEKENVQEIRRERLQSISSFGSSIHEEEPQETDELIEKGAIPTSTYVEYWRAGATIFILLFLAILLIIAQMASNASDLWVTHWTNAEEVQYNLTHHEDIKKTSTDVFDTENSTDVLNTRNQRDIFNLTSTVNPEITTLTSVITTVTPAITTLIPDLTTLSFNLTATLGNDTEIGNFTNATLATFEMSSLRSRNSYIIIYTVFILGSILLTSARSLLYYKVCMTSSINLHNKMFSNVLQAPMRFFDTNPSGRILNRFSKDMGAIDELLPKATLDALQIFLVMSGILAMVFIVTPWIVFPAIILGILFYYFRVVYLASAQDVKRLEGTTKAPVFSHISATLYGIPTIRSSNAEQMITREFDVLQDQHTSTWFMFLSTSEAFGFFLDIISTAFLALVTFQFLIFRDDNTLSGNVGLVISQSLILTGMLQFGVRQTAEVASNMTSVERVLQYTKLDKEGPFESLPTKKPDRNWPQTGKITFSNVYLRYAPDEPPVLKNLNMEIKSGEKVGIVGRTGAGKSSLIASLFRLTPIEGTIAIDDVDASTIGLNDLRSNISIIPQEPVLFSSSIRYNLDPFEKVDDDKIWQALENVELKGAIDNLDQQVSEGGSNFSAGQRQLICLARAIVRNNKILVMDEATANVDLQTDSLIQKTIRLNFKNCTVVTIAHRLNTVMDSDRVLVMDAGQAVEFDHPHQLLQKPNGYFTKMVKQTGSSMEAALRKVAQEDHEKKFEDVSANEEVIEDEESKKDA